MATNEALGTDLRGYMAVIRRWKWMIALTVVLVVASALVFSFLQTPVYQGQARLIVEPGQSVFGAGGRWADPLLAATELQVIQGQQVREEVRKRLGVAPPVSATIVGETAVIEVRANSTDAAQAAKITNTYVESYIDYRRQQAIDESAAAAQAIQRKVDGLQEQINALSDKINLAPPCPRESTAPCIRVTLEKDRDNLLSQQIPFKQKLDELQVDTSLSSVRTRVVLPASVPESPVSPRPVRNGLLAVLVGLVLGTALAFLFEHLDDSIKTRDDLARAARDVSVLGLIPVVQGWKNSAEAKTMSQAEPTSPAAEAYRALRTSIQFLALDQSLRTLVITSPNRSEGKSAATANLGVALARAGQRVAIVSCDLRRPRLHHFFGLSNTVGFTSVILGEAPLSAALQDVPGEPRLHLLAAGSLPPNPSELLTGTRAADVLTALRASHDIVLLDSPPVLPVTDAAVIAARVDGTLLVAMAGATTGKAFTRALETLRQVEARVVGAVLNGVSTRDDAYVYEYYTRDDSENGAKRPGSGKSSRPVTKP